MPANRSRTERWKDMLELVAQRAGALEIALKPAAGPDPNEGADRADIVWRCRVLGLADNAVTVEMPMAVGQPIRIAPGTELLVAFSVGQNRWMFHTRVEGYRVFASARGQGSEHAAMTIAMPDRVERCSRREHFRISTSQINLPRVQCWPLLDPTSVIAAEAANRARMRELLASPGTSETTESVSSILLPDVGPMFEGRLLNLSGGGLGLLLGHNESVAADRARYLWLRVDLRPEVPVPMAITAKRAHSHLDSTGNVYAGLAFDFGYNPEHQRFVFELLSSYVDHLQQRARARTSKAG
ncbi:MAG: flagellar brake domain-containing protein [Phycisphaerales bacterium]